MKKKIFIAIPSINGKVKNSTRVALTCAHMEILGRGWEAKEVMRERDSIVQQARNVLLSQFVVSDCTDMLWLDSDVAFPPGTMTRLMSHNVDFVAGIYRAKREEEKYMVHANWNAKTWIDQNTGLMEAVRVPIGFCRMTRSCAEALVKADEDNWFKTPDTGELKVFNVFEVIFDKEYRLLWGEDFSVCNKWRKLGGKVMVDTDLTLHHIGRKGMTFSGCYGDWLKKQEAAPIPQDLKASMAEAMAALPPDFAAQFKQ